ncbi:MAG TPA: ATP-binding protein [Acidimicrobiales bacterium]|nr:ATP-binding protein [Acidimicrobiales bacterium]
MTITQTRGRLYGKNVLEGEFRAAPNDDLFLGELLVAVDEATGRRYLFRVVDVTYGHEHREPGWAERVAGTLLSDDTRDTPGAHPLYEQERRTYRVAECRCLGYLTPDGKEFRKPKSLPTQFSRVVSPEPADLAFLERSMGDLHVGVLRTGETTVDVPVGVSGESLAKHVGVFATTGMGKSNLMMVLAGAAMQANGRYGLLIIDPHGEYRTELARHPWAQRRLRTYSSVKAPNTSALRVSLGEMTSDDLRTATGDTSRAQTEALFELERFYSSQYPGLSWLLAFAQIDDLVGFRDVDLGRSVALSTLQVLHRRAKRICNLEAISADADVSVAAQIERDLREGKVVLVDASGLDSTEELLVASFLTRKVLEAWQQAFLDDRDAHAGLPTVAVVLEEAQRVLSKANDGDVNVFPRVAREGRKFKVGLVAVTQQPKLVDAELLSQFNTFFILGLADERDRNILKGSAKQDLSALNTEIQTLMPGECLLAGVDTPFAVPAAIHLWSDALRNATAPPEPRPVADVNVGAMLD